MAGFLDLIQSLVGAGGGGEGAPAPNQPFASVLDNIRKYSQPVQSPTGADLPVERVVWPTVDDQLAHLNSNNQYGTVNAGFFDEGTEPSVRKISPAGVGAVLNTNGDVQNMGQLSKVDPNTRNQMHKNVIAAGKSAVSSLGMDLRKFATSDQSHTDVLNILGAYFPDARNMAGDVLKKRDSGWWDQKEEAALVHEATHRGFFKLRSQDPEAWSALVKKFKQDQRIPPEAKSEEHLVRALMMRNFGDIEQQGDRRILRKLAGDEYMKTYKGNSQIKEARQIPQDVLDEFEAAAANLIARKQPKGPR